MATSICTGAIRQVLAYVRVEPSNAGAILGVAPSGMSGYRVLDAQGGDGSNWLRLACANGITGWVRDDLIDIVGDCSAEGYGVLTEPKQASTLIRNLPPKPPEPLPPPKQPTPTPAPMPIPVPSPDPTPGLPALDDPVRIREASFNVTSGFEGGGYDTYQNYDTGIVSYGRFGFTLASGSLFSVLDLYLQTATTPVANQLRTLYLQRVQDRDDSLRDDVIFRDYLKFAADDPIMQAAQNQIATDLYWNLVQELSIQPRGIVSPLGQAFIFDTAINHGARHDMIGLAEEYFGVPSKSKLGQNGISEQQLIAKVAEIRRDRLYKIADAQNLPGLKPRGDFWVNIMAAGDWDLAGDLDGFVTIKPGRKIQVRNP